MFDPNLAIDIPYRTLCTLNSGAVYIHGTSKRSPAQDRGSQFHMRECVRQFPQGKIVPLLLEPTYGQS